MREITLVCIMAVGITLSLSLAKAEDGLYVIPVKKRNYAPVAKAGQTKPLAYRAIFQESARDIWDGSSRYYHGTRAGAVKNLSGGNYDECNR